MSGTVFARQLTRQLDTVTDGALLGVVAAALSVASRRGLYDQQDQQLLRQLTDATAGAVRRAQQRAEALPPADDAQLDLGL